MENGCQCNRNSIGMKFGLHWHEISNRCLRLYKHLVMKQIENKDFAFFFGLLIVNFFPTSRQSVLSFRASYFPCQNSLASKNKS